MNRSRAVLAMPITALVALGVAALAFRMYAPGDLGERLARAQQKWSIFAQATTWTFLGRGLALTVELAVVSIVLSFALAVVFALLRLAPHPRMRAPLPGAAIVSRVVGGLVEVIRSTPLFMLVIYSFIALPKLGLDLPAFWSGVFALTLYTSCVTSEIVRAGILSLDRGQFDAALALGLSYTKRLRWVVLPQALRRMVPAIVSQLATLVKDTSLVSAITIVELARRGQILQQFANNPIETSIVVMALYFGLNFALSQLAARLERQRGGIRPTAALGAEDQIAPVPA